MRWAIRTREAADDAGKTPPLPARALVRFAPAGLVEVNSLGAETRDAPSRDRRS